MALQKQNKQHGNVRWKFILIIKHLKGEGGEEAGFFLKKQATKQLLLLARSYLKATRCKAREELVMPGEGEQIFVRHAFPLSLYKWAIIPRRLSIIFGLQEQASGLCVCPLSARTQSQWGVGMDLFNFWWLEQWVRAVMLGCKSLSAALCFQFFFLPCTCLLGIGVHAILPLLSSTTVVAQPHKLWKKEEMTACISEPAGLRWEQKRRCAEIVQSSSTSAAWLQKQKGGEVGCAEQAGLRCDLRKEEGKTHARMKRRIFHRDRAMSLLQPSIL